MRLHTELPNIRTFGKDYLRIENLALFNAETLRLSKTDISICENEYERFTALYVYFTLSVGSPVGKPVCRPNNSYENIRLRH